MTRIGGEEELSPPPLVEAEEPLTPPPLVQAPNYLPGPRPSAPAATEQPYVPTMSEEENRRQTEELYKNWHKGTVLIYWRLVPEVLEDINKNETIVAEGLKLIPLPIVKPLQKLAEGIATGAEVAKIFYSVVNRDWGGATGQTLRKKINDVGKKALAEYIEKKFGSNLAKLAGKNRLTRWLMEKLGIKDVSEMLAGYIMLILDKAFGDMLEHGIEKGIKDFLPVGPTQLPESSPHLVPVGPPR